MFLPTSVEMKMSQLTILAAMDWNDKVDFADVQDEMSVGADISDRKLSFASNQCNPTFFPPFFSPIFLYRLF